MMAILTFAPSCTAVVSSACGHLETAITDHRPDFFVRFANQAPMAEGRPKPIVPAPPEVSQRLGFSR